MAATMNGVNGNREVVEPSRAGTPEQPFRKVVPKTLSLVVLGAIGLLLLRTWGIAGIVVPFEVTSGSMGPSLLGRHRQVVCDDCGHRFASDVGRRPALPRIACPNCRFPDNGLAELPEVSGDRLVTLPTLFQFRPVRRFEVVLFRHPHSPGEICVKRVVGLPGESVEIRRGDVYIDGKIARKSLAQQRAVALLVHDANRTARRESTHPYHWQPDRKESGWERQKGQFSHGYAGDDQAIDWLTYHHPQRTPDPKNPDRETPITNRRPDNQSERQRPEDVQVVGDVRLAFRLTGKADRGQLFLMATDGLERFEVRVDFDQKRWEILRNQVELEPPLQGPMPRLPNGGLVEVCLVDRQFAWAIDGRTIAAYPFDRTVGPSAGTTRPLAIGVRGAEVTIRDLKVFRDVYYGRPVGAHGRWGLDRPVELAADEYFVLGDNSPISADSRVWPQGPGVHANLLLGKPFLIHLPSRSMAIGQWHIQVPDLAKIRYIR